MTAVFDMTDPAARARGLAAARAALRRGLVVALPVDAGYGLAVDAFAADAAGTIHSARGRATSAIPVLVARIGTVDGIARVDARARALMRAHWPGPLTLVLPAQPSLVWSLSDAGGRIAVRQPLHPVALELLAVTGPLGVVAAGPEATTGASALADGRGEHVGVLLDGGALPGGPASVVIDLTGPDARLTRPGPIPIAELRDVCPGLVVATPGPGATAP